MLVCSTAIQIKISQIRARLHPVDVARDMTGRAPAQVPSLNARVPQKVGSATRDHVTDGIEARHSGLDEAIIH